MMCMIIYVFQSINVHVFNIKRPIRWLVYTPHMFSYRALMGVPVRCVLLEQLDSAQCCWHIAHIHGSSSHPLIWLPVRCYGVLPPLAIW